MTTTQGQQAAQPLFHKHIQWTIRHEGDRKLKIYGETYLPRGFESYPFPRPTIVLAHGFGSTHERMDPYARALAQRGYVTYNIDFCGGGIASKSDGDFLDMSIQTEKDDLLAAMGLMREEPFCDPKSLFLVGASQGGVVASLVAEEHPELVRGLVLLYPAFVLHDDALAAYPAGTAVPEHPLAHGREVGRRYVEDARAYDPAEHQTYAGPVRILHGSADAVVPVRYAQEAARRYPQAELTVYGGAGHGFEGEVLDEAAAATVDFVFDVLHKASSDKQGVKEESTSK